MNLRAALLAGAALAFQGSLASAQTPAPSPAATQDAGQLDEVVVTATRREQALQDVPVAVQFIQGDELARRQIVNTTDIVYAAPSITFLQGSSPGSGSFSMRGVGTIGFAPSVEQSVGLVVDGISVGFRGASEGALVDMAGIQVLRGPQGTLFGKNASAGLVVMTTNAPVLNELSARIRGEYGSVDARRGLAVVNAPIGDKAAIRLVGNWEKRDGLQTDLTTGRRYNDNDDRFMRGRFRWQPTERLRIDFGAHDEFIYANCCNPALLGVGDPNHPLMRVNLANGLVPGRHNRDGFWTHFPHSKTRNTGQFLEVNYDVGPAMLTSLTGHLIFKQYFQQDGDNSIQPVNDVLAFKHLDEYTQEFRLTSQEPLFSKIDYVFGLYLYRHSYMQDQSAIGVIGTRTLDVVHNNSVAGFGTLTWHATDKLQFVAGGRYTSDSIDQVSATGRYGPFALVPTSGDVSSTNFSPRFVVQYDWTPDIMTFASFTKGYKGPAFSQVPPAVGGQPGRPFEVNPEISKEWAAGIRSQFFNRRAMVNLTLFHDDVKNYQSVTFDSTLFVAILRNAGAVQTRGAELEMAFRPARGWTVTGNAAYVDGVFTDFKGVSCSLMFRTFYPTLCPGGRIDATGVRLPDSSKLTANLTIDYEREISSKYRVALQGSYNHRSKVNYQPTGDPFTIQPAYGLLNFNASIGDIEDRWTLSLIARNILDQDFSPAISGPTGSQVGPTTSRVITAAARRYVGVALDLKFGGPR